MRETKDWRTLRKVSSTWSVVSAQALPFDTIHARLRSFVRKTVASAGVRPPDVDDVVQEVFVLLHRKGGIFVDLRAARSWLYRASRRLASNYMRGVRRSAARQPGWSPAPPSDPQAQLEVRCVLGRVAQAATQLDTTAVSAFTMVELQGLPSRDAADALGLNVNTTRSHVQRVRKRLCGVATVGFVVLAIFCSLFSGTCTVAPVVALQVGAGAELGHSERPCADARAPRAGTPPA